MNLIPYSHYSRSVLNCEKRPLLAWIFGRAWYPLDIWVPPPGLPTKPAAGWYGVWKTNYKKSGGLLSQRTYAPCCAVRRAAHWHCISPKIHLHNVFERSYSQGDVSSFLYVWQLTCFWVRNISLNPSAAFILACRNLRITVSSTTCGYNCAYSVLQNLLVKVHHFFYMLVISSPGVKSFHGDNQGMLYSDCLRPESNFLASTRRVTALCVCVYCIACVCDCVMVIRKPTCK